MSHKRMIYKKDYQENKPFKIWSNKTTTCLSSLLICDQFGFRSENCRRPIDIGQTVYYKDCECYDITPYCSEKCCWGKCEGCKRKICTRCYMYRNMNCVYCAHKGEECECDSEEYLCGSGE